MCLSQWPRGLRRGFAVARVLGLRVRITLRAWISVSCECFVLSGRGLCVGLITCSEEFYRLWCVCDLEASTRRKRWPTRGCCAVEKEDRYIIPHTMLVIYKQLKYRA
jgi:hypothetical protein